MGEAGGFLAGWVGAGEGVEVVGVAQDVGGVEAQAPGDHMRTRLVADALEAAVVTRGGRVDGVIFHSDRGSQYGSAEFASLCRRHGIRRSMGKVGSSYDNAAAESFFASLKRELMHGACWTSRSQVRLEVFRWISFYNVRRRHSTLGYLSPIQFEQQTAASRRITLAA